MEVTIKSQIGYIQTKVKRRSRIYDFEARGILNEVCDYINKIAVLTARNHIIKRKGKTPNDSYGLIKIYNLKPEGITM